MIVAEDDSGGVDGGRGGDNNNSNIMCKILYIVVTILSFVFRSVVGTLK